MKLKLLMVNILKRSKKKIKLEPQSRCLNQKKIRLTQNILLKISVLMQHVFILSDSPPEKDVQWSEEGITSSFKFIQKL